MVSNLRSILKPKSIKRPIDPIEIFQSSRVNDPSINDLWLAQGDALRQWHKKREASDVTIVLNTGAGKTLVGLLVAQSLVNETRGKVLYLCSSNQLIEQTLEKAQRYGLPVTTYYEGEFNNDLYKRCEAPCLTNYHALFNGRSIFLREDLVALIFDDAHVAEHILRDQFTLTIARDELPETYDSIFALFGAYFTQIGKSVGYQETYRKQDLETLWLIPPFEVLKNRSEIERILLDTAVNDRTSTKFAWAYLRDQLKLCAIILSAAQIVITPPFIPVRTLKYFQEGIRRVYLSATPPSSDIFLRTFGTKPEEVIQPETKAGECERLIIVPSVKANKDNPVDDIAVAKSIIADKKALILTPTYDRCAVWQDVVTVGPDDAISNVHTFRDADADKKDKLALVQRYDGIDLPGDTCRVMVIDELPFGIGLYERYLLHYLGVNTQFRSTVASRIVQSFGRISRGMSDYGVVVLTGKSLVDWILVPKNQDSLPAFLQKQLQLGLTVSYEFKPEQYLELVEQCLSRDSEWVQAYEENMQDDSGSFVKSDDSQDLIDIALTEVEAAEYLWKQDFRKAATKLQNDLDNAFKVNQGTGAWHALWLGYCYELLGDLDLAQFYYSRAHKANMSIPPYVSIDLTVGTRETPSQIRAVAKYLRDALVSRKAFLQRFDNETLYFSGNGNARQHEEAIRSLGEYLGLESSRPEKEHGTGPDVLWVSDTGPDLCIEAKTRKTSSECYTRTDDIGKMYDHLGWCEKNTRSKVIPCFVGPLLPPSPASNPPEDTIVIDLPSLRQLTNRLRAALVDILDNATQANIESVTEAVFTRRNLLWPTVLMDISRKLADIEKQ